MTEKNVRKKTSVRTFFVSGACYLRTLWYIPPVTFMLKDRICEKRRISGFKIMQKNEIKKQD